MFLRLVTLILVFVPLLVHGEDELGRWSEFVPESKTVEARVMVLGPPEDIRQISEKVEKAREADPEFFEAQRAATEPDQPMTYDARMGISETEYQRLLEGAQELELVPAGETELKFSADDLGVAVVSGLPMAAPHHELRYDLEQDTMYTPYGDLVTLAKVAQDDADAPTGRWEGYQWSVGEQTSDEDWTVIRFAMGKLQDQPSNMIFYDVNVARKGKAHQYHYVLLFPSE